MKYFCRFPVASVSLSIYLPLLFFSHSLSLSLSLSLSFFFLFLLLCRSSSFLRSFACVKGTTCRFCAHSSTLKRAKLKERDSQESGGNIHPLAAFAEGQPYLTLAGHGASIFHASLPAGIPIPYPYPSPSEESSDGDKLLRRFVAYLVKRWLLRFVPCFFHFSFSFS